MSQEELKRLADEMMELSKRLGKWPKIKKAYQAIENIPPDKLNNDQKQTVNKYNKLKPIREQVREIKAKRDKLKSEMGLDKPKPKKGPYKPPQGLKFTKLQFQNQLVRFQLEGDKQDRICGLQVFMEGIQAKPHLKNPEFIEDSLLKRKAENENNRAIENKGYAKGFYRGERQSGTHLRKGGSRIF